MRDPQLQSLLARSQELTKEGKVPEALATIEAAIALDPTSAWAWAHQGDVLYQHLGEYERAIASFGRALALDPDYAWAIAHRGASYERLDMFAEAERDFDRALALKPGYTWALAMLARVYQMTGRYEQAFAAVEDVTAKEPSLLPYWREERAMMRMLLRRHEDADRHFRIAFEADPEDRFAHYNSTVNLVHWQGVDRARAAIDRLRERLQRNIETSQDSREVDRCTYELGGLAALEGHDDDALARLQAAIAREKGLVLLSPARKRARVDMAWLHLRADPRFTTMIALPITRN